MEEGRGIMGAAPFFLAWRTCIGARKTRAGPSFRQIFRAFPVCDSGRDVPMFGRFKNRKAKSDGRSTAHREDEAIIHLSVPDEVLYPEAKAAEPGDMSWLDDLPLVDDDGPQAAVRPTPVSEEMASAEAEEESPSRPANAATDGRPKFPYGWLVIVEGDDTGAWYPLERGASTIGPADDCTIRVRSGSRGRVALAFDEARHAFILDADAAVRVNGVERRGSEPLRDGDTITLGRESLRLVALCSQNFHWAKDIAAE